jgi:hypothetical protein
MGSAMLEGEGGEAGEDEQSPGRPELGGGGAVQSEVPGTQEQSEDGQVDEGATRSATQAGTPRRRARVSAFPKPKVKVSPTTCPW